MTRKIASQRELAGELDNDEILDLVTSRAETLRVLGCFKGFTIHVDSYPEVESESGLRCGNYSLLEIAIDSTDEMALLGSPTQSQYVICERAPDTNEGLLYLTQRGHILADMIQNRFPSDKVSIQGDLREENHSRQEKNQVSSKSLSNDTLHVCKNCSAHLNPDWDFCPACGHSVGVARRGAQKVRRSSKVKKAEAEESTNNRCNLCGIPESKIDKNGYCNECAPERCKIEKWMWITQDIYDNAKELDLLQYWVNNHMSFSAVYIRIRLADFSYSERQHIPQCLRDAISCDGMLFSSIEEFTPNIVFRVCRENKSRALPIGTLVWRSDKGLTLGKEKEEIPAEKCAEVLNGTHFEAVCGAPLPESE